MSECLPHILVLSRKPSSSWPPRHSWILWFSMHSRFESTKTFTFQFSLCTSVRKLTLIVWKKVEDWRSLSSEVWADVTHRISSLTGQHLRSPSVRRSEYVLRVSRSAFVSASSASVKQCIALGDWSDHNIGGAGPRIGSDRHWWINLGSRPRLDQELGAYDHVYLLSLLRVQGTFRLHTCMPPLLYIYTRSNWLSELKPLKLQMQIESECIKLCIKLWH